MTDKGIFCGNNTPKDPANMTDAEKKHTPVIDCPDTVKVGEPFQVKINIGSMPHVMEEAHHIQWIDVHSGDNFNVRVDLTPVFTKPEVTKIAQMSHDGLARSVSPCHTPFDGDTVFALATGKVKGADLMLAGSLAAEVTATALVRAALTAKGLPGLPAHCDIT